MPTATGQSPANLLAHSDGSEKYSWRDNEEGQSAPTEQTKAKERQDELLKHQPRARSHVEHSSSMVGTDVPILDMRKQSFRLDNLAKVMGSRVTCVQDYFFWGCPAPLGGGNPEPSWRRRMLLSGCRHHATPKCCVLLQSPSHSYKHFSPFLTDVPPGTDREKPRGTPDR